MSHPPTGKVRDEAIRAIIFVFVLLAAAEVAAPFFQIEFHDPLLFSAFVFGILSNVIAPKVSNNKPQLIVISQDSLTETEQKLSAAGVSHNVTFAESPDHVVTLAKTITPAKAGVIKLVKGLLPR